MTYQLWDPTTDHIFNSFHVSFIETCQLPLSPPTSNNIQDSILPTHLLPNTINNHPTSIPPITSSASNIPITDPQCSTIPYPIRLPSTQSFHQVLSPPLHAPVLPHDMSMTLTSPFSTPNLLLSSSNINNNAPFYNTQITSNPHTVGFKTIAMFGHFQLGSM